MAQHWESIDAAIVAATGWPSIGENAANHAEMRRRIAVLEERPALAGSELVGLLRSFASTLDPEVRNPGSEDAEDAPADLSEDIPEDALDVPVEESEPDEATDPFPSARKRS